MSLTLDHTAASPAPAAAPTQRIDKWLWCARFFKSRTLAARFVAEGRVRLNRARVSKASQGLRSGDVLTFALGDQVCVIRVLALAERRGPAAEARGLYEELAPRAEPRPS